MCRREANGVVYGKCMMSASMSFDSCHPGGPTDEKIFTTGGKKARSIDGVVKSASRSLRSESR